jgi:two-component system, OmpR family, response regulator QseB
MRLLIVEDETRIAELVKASLARAGFTVDVMGLCADARAALEVTTYDAAIADLGLPDGDGLELLREIRTRGNQTPILCSPRVTRSKIVCADSIPVPMIIS